MFLVAETVFKTYEIPLGVLAILLMVGSAVLNLGYARRFANPNGLPNSRRVRLFQISAGVALVAAVLTGLVIWFG